VQITNNSGESCDFTVVKHPAPPGGGTPDAGEMPTQWEITTTCSTPNVNLVFSYTDAELANANSVNEANLVTFKHTGGQTWVSQGGVVDTGANTVTLTGVTSLSSWALGDSSGDAPTILALSSFTVIPGNLAALPLISLLGAFGMLLYLRKK
jgi:hypothetical protein